MHMSNTNAAPQVDAVIFDIGGVLVRIDLSAALSAVMRVAPSAMPAMLKLASDPMLLDFECGKISEQEFHAYIVSLAGGDFPYEQYCECWNSIFQGSIEPTLALLEDLNRRTNLKIGILSNTNQTHFDWLRARISAIESLEHVYASHEIGFRKPEREAYLYVLEKMDVVPDRAVFIDDLPVNLDGARAVGMHVIHATEPAAVRAGLAELGVVTKKDE